MANQQDEDNRDKGRGPVGPDPTQGSAGPYIGGGINGAELMNREKDDLGGTGGSSGGGTHAAYGARVSGGTTDRTTDSASPTSGDSGDALGGGVMRVAGGTRDDTGGLTNVAGGSDLPAGADEGDPMDNRLGGGIGKDGMAPGASTGDMSAGRSSEMEDDLPVPYSPGAGLGGDPGSPGGMGGSRAQGGTRDGRPEGGVSPIQNENRNNENNAGDTGGGKGKPDAYALGAVGGGAGLPGGEPGNRAVGEGDSRSAGGDTTGSAPAEDVGLPKHGNRPGELGPEGDTKGGPTGFGASGNAVGESSDVGGADTDPLLSANKDTTPADLGGMGGQRKPGGSSRD